MTQAAGQQANRERSFGVSVGAVTGALAVAALWRQEIRPAAALGALSLTLLGLAILKPSLLALPSAVWWRAARALGWVNTRLILTGLFFILVTPVGLLARGLGWDPLRIRRARRATSWEPYPERFRDPKHYERMY